MSVQDKLSKHQVKSFRKLRDYSIRVNGVETKVVRLKVQRNMYGDSTGFGIVSDDVINIVLDLPNEIPLSRLRKDVTKEVPQTQNIYLHEILPIEGQAESAHNIEREDILVVRIFDEKDGEPDKEDKPYLFVLRVSEMLGMIGNRHIVAQKFQCAPYNVALPQSIQDLVDEYLSGDDYYYDG